MKKISVLLLLVFFSSHAKVEGAPFHAINLKCEYRENPLGIDVFQPSLSWQVETLRKNWDQTAYEIKVAGSEAMLEQDKGDIWESGKIKSCESINIQYKGSKLISKKRYHWKVRVWDSNGNPSPWSDNAYWACGIFDPSEWQAKWISSRYVEAKQGRLQIPEREHIILPMTPDTAALLLRKEVKLAKQPVNATAFICGLGYYELYINGEKVGDHVLDPNFTDYTARINYVTYDILDDVRTGKNAIGVILGNGWYNLPTPDLFQNEKACWKSAPKLLLNIFIEFSDGTTQTIASDDTWKWNTGEIIFNCIRGGETINNQLQQSGWEDSGYDDSSWERVMEVPAPFGNLSAQDMPPMRKSEQVKPIKMWEPSKGIFVFDFGRNITGWARLEVSGNKGQKITLQYNEKLLKDSTLNTNNSRSHTWGRFQTDIFILNGEGIETFEPRFTYHGFRYVQIDGLETRPGIDCMVAQNVHTDLHRVGRFECSNPRINQLQSAVQRTLLNCIHGIPGEEPTREKMGWTQDGQNTMEAYIYNFDVATSYLKYLRDLTDAQEPNGHVPPIVPTAGWGCLQAGDETGFFHSEANTIYCDDPWWGATLAVVANKLYEYYGNNTIIEEAYKPMKRYVDFLTSTADNNIIKWSLGDWCDKEHTWKGGPGLTPVELTSTAGYYYLAKILARNADILGKKEDSEKYFRLAYHIKAAFNREFLNARSGVYAGGSQTAQAITLSYGLVPDRFRTEVEAMLISDIVKNDYHTTSGFIGIMPKMNYLAENSYTETAYKLLTQEDAPGWLYMVENETSTLGEQLYSRNDNFHHPFGACIGSWLYAYLAGIRPDPEIPGFKQFIINPGIVEDVTWVNAEYNSIFGKIFSEWKTEDGDLYFNFSIPANTSARVYVPAKEEKRVFAGETIASKSEGVNFIKMENGKAVFQVGSGNYQFTSAGFNASRTRDFKDKNLIFSKTDIR